MLFTVRTLLPGFSVTTVTETSTSGRRHLEEKLYSILSVSIDWGLSDHREERQVLRK